MRPYSICKKSPLVSTFSIVAFDPSTRELGVAVQSRYFSVGSVVPWAEAGVGAIATQSFVNVSYGPKGLELLKQGILVYDVIDRLTKDDVGKDSRQLGVIDAKGNAAAFTGKKCLEWAGSKVGKNYSVQGNILASEDVVNRMAESFEFAKGDLGSRLVAALEGGENAGGDARGRQSAALLVVRENRGRASYGDRYIDLRVEDHSNPIGELKRLLDMHRVYSLIDESEEELTKNNFETALSTLKKAAALNPNVDDIHVDLGIINMKLGRKEEAVKAFEEALRLNPKLKNLIKQLPKAGWIDADREVLEKLGIK